VQSVDSQQNEQAAAGVGDETAATMKGATLAVASAATALVLIVFTVPLTTLTATAQALCLCRRRGPGLDLERDERGRRLGASGEWRDR
jgi:hypothetical protein